MLFPYTAGKKLSDLKMNVKLQNTSKKLLLPELSMALRTWGQDQLFVEENNDSIFQHMETV